VITVTNLTYINATSVCQLLGKLGALGLQVPITLVLDNARYQRCTLVQSVADTLSASGKPACHSKWNLLAQTLQVNLNPFSALSIACLYRHSVRVSPGLPKRVMGEYCAGRGARSIV